jgi:glutathione S-transferase
MITVFGEGRGFRVVWLLEEMGLPYRLRRVDLLAGVENDPEFLAINPAGFIPAIVDGDVTMVESIAIMEYLMARYGPTPLAPEPQDSNFSSTSSSCTSAKRASPPRSISSTARATSRRNPNATTTPAGMRWRRSRPGWAW